MERDLSGFTLFEQLAWRNAPERDRGIVFARDLFERNDELLRLYPNWDVWRYAPPDGRPSSMPELQHLFRAGRSE